MEYKSIREKGPMTSDIEPLCLLCVYLSLSLFSIMYLYVIYIWRSRWVRDRLTELYILVSRYDQAVKQQQQENRASYEIRRRKGASEKIVQIYAE